MVDPDKQTPITEEAEMMNNSTEPVSADATVLSDLESLIKSHITGIDKKKLELRKLREMVNDALANDPTYREHDKTAKDAAKIRSATKSQILKLSANQNIVQKARELATEMKESDEALSEYLREFGRLSGASEIETDDGQVREIIYTAKLIKKSSR